jgi:hypothetical protein
LFCPKESREIPDTRNRRKVFGENVIGRILFLQISSLLFVLALWGPFQKRCKLFSMDGLVDNEDLG